MKSVFVRQVILTIIVSDQIDAMLNRFPLHSSDLFPKISHAQPKTITSLIFFRGGSQSDGNDHEVKDFASDAVEKAEINEEAFQVKKSYDSSTQRDYHDIEDVEVIPFDSEDEIIPFDSEDESSSSIDSVDSVLVGSDNDENILENVEIIPFDTDYDEYNTYDTVPLPFDDMAEGYDYHSDRTIIDNADDVDRDQNDSCVEINLKDTHNRYVPGPEDMSESLISTENTTESFRRFSTLRDRILSLLSVWRDMDRENIEDGEEDSHSVRGMLHRRAAEYVEELTAFQTECTLSIAQNISISTTLEKMAPRPKTFLHYITPKIQAVKLSPEIMLRIRNAQPNDVGDAIRAIGILGCLVDLYNIALAELTPLVENRSYDQSEKVRREIREDRRFGQLLECASCGIDRRGRLEKFQNSQNDGILFPGAEDDQDVEENFSSDTEDDEEKQPECIEVSECSRWIMGMISLEVYGGMAIRSQNTTGVVLSLAMRSSDLLQASFRNVGTDEKARKSLLRDIIDTVRVLSCARDEWNIDVNFILDMCLELLWKDVASAQVNNEGIYSEYEMDEIVNKLTLSETIEIDDKISNSTSLPLNTTSLPLNSISTENDKYDDPSQNCASPPVRLIDYMSPQQRIVVVKSCTRLLGISRVARKTVSVLLDSCIDDLDSDIKMLKRAKAKDSTHEIECVDAVILFASIANKNDDEKLLNTVASKVAGSQEIFSQSINTSDKMQVEKSSIMHNVLDDNSELILEDLTVTRVPNRLPLESIATSVKARCRGVIWDQIQCAVPTFPISKSLKIMVSTKQGEVGSLFTNTSRSPQRSTYIDVSQVNSMQIAKNSLKTSLYDCSVIIQAVVSINHSTAARIMESCLKISAASSYETIQKMENGDAVNLISGIASIGSSMPMSLQAATKLSLMIRLTLCREYWTFSFTQLSRLLEAIATVISTQRFPIIHGLVDDESVLALIEHGMERMKCSDLATIQDLSNLAWVYAECNKLCSRSSWEHFEILGRCVAAVSSSFVHVDMSTDENTSPVIDHNILCKIAFAVSLMDLDSHDLNQAILKYSRKDQSLFSSANLLNQIRLLYSIAKSKQDVEQSMSPEYNTDVKRCIGAVMKSKLDVLSPYNFALVVWSIGRLCGEEVSSLMTNLPSYTREELGVLSPTMTLRLMNGIVMVFDAHDIQTNTRVQLMLKNLLLHLDSQIIAMSPKELCGASRIIVNLRSYCFTEGDEEVVGNQKSSNVDKLILGEGEGDIENEAEEFVINSLFPSSNRRDMMQLCDAIIPRLVNRSITSITYFTAKEMTTILDTFDVKYWNTLFDIIQTEINRRLGLVRRDLSKTEGADMELDTKSEGKSENSSYKSKLRNLFTVGSAIPSIKGYTAYDGLESEEVSQVVNLLRNTLNEDALNQFLLRTALNSAYDLGRCRWQTTRSLQNMKSVRDWSLSDLYP